MKRLIKLVYTGATIGITIGFLIALGFSLLYQTTNFYPSSPAFVAHFSSPLIATLVSAVIWALIGVVFTLTSLFFEQVKWSLAKQIGLHFIVSYLLFTPLAIMSGWFPLTWAWLGWFTLIFIGIYLVISISTSIYDRELVTHVNQLLQQRRSEH